MSQTTARPFLPAGARAGTSKAHPRRGRRLLFHRVLPILLVLALLLGLLRLALPAIAEREINSRLAMMGDYTGRIEAVDINLWRGNYQLHDLKIQRRGGEVPVPLLDAPLVDISLSWRNLLRGGIVAEASFERPQVHFVHGKGDEDSQAGTGVDWREKLENLVPIRLDEVEVRDGTVHFQNFTSSPQVDLKATGVNAEILNLTNVRDAEGRRVAELQATGTLFESGRIESTARFDPFGRAEEFDFALRVLGIDLTQVNTFARAYAGLDFESGNGELVMEIEAEDGQLGGYAKPLFQQLNILSWEDDSAEADGNVLEIAWEAAAEAVTELFTNQPAEQFGTRIEIDGDIGDPEVSTLQAVGGVLRNAFIEAFRPYFEGTGLRVRGND